MTPRNNAPALRKTLGIAAAIATIAAPALALEAHLSVDGGGRGQAALFTRGGACFALTPRHVISGRRYSMLLIPGGEEGPRHAEGDVCAEWPELDLSLLRVKGQAPSGCGDPLATVPPVERLLPAGGAGALRYSNENGSTEWMDVLVTFRGHGRTVGVRPRGSTDQLRQGLSGSTLYLSDLPAGLLVSATADPSAEGEVVRLDFVVPLLNILFERKEGAILRDSSCLTTRSIQITGKEGVRIDYASATNGGEIVHWGAPPIASQHRPEMMIAPQNEPGYWAVETTGSAFAVLRLAEIRMVSRIDLDFRNVPRTIRPAWVQLLSRGSEEGPWTALAVFRPSETQASGTLALAPRLVREIRIEIAANSPKQRIIGIGRVSAYE